MKYLLTALLALMFTSAYANPYVRISGGSSSWDSPTVDLHSRDNQPLFDDQTNRGTQIHAGGIAIGSRVTDDFRVELEYNHYGDEKLGFVDAYTKCIFIFCKEFEDLYATNFTAYGITGWVVYDAFTWNIAEKVPLTFNIRGGFSRGNMKATVNDVAVKDSDGGVAYGAGLDLGFGSSFSVNASWEQHSFVFDNDFDYEPKLAKLGVTWQF
jgi:hypothetical protein